MCFEDFREEIGRPVLYSECDTADGIKKSREKTVECFMYWSVLLSLMCHSSSSRARNKNAYYAFGILNVVLWLLLLDPYSSSSVSCHLRDVYVEHFQEVQPAVFVLYHPLPTPKTGQERLSPPPIQFVAFPLSHYR